MTIKKMIKSKKGVSPIIATILLIALVLMIGMIVFAWLKGMTKEAITKFDGENIQIVCGDVSFDASYSSNTLTIQNLGNVPIYDFDINMEYPGGHETHQISDTDFNWLSTGLNQGGLVSDTIDLPTGTDKIILIPILLGVDKEGNKQSETCDKRYGFDIFIQ